MGGGSDSASSLTGVHYIQGTGGAAGSELSYRELGLCTATHCTTLHYTTLHCTALHFTTLHYTTLHCTALHFTTLHCTALHCTALHYTTLHYTTLHYTALRYATPHNTIHATKLHCNTHTYTHTHTHNRPSHVKQCSAAGTNSLSVCGHWHCFVHRHSTWLHCIYHRVCAYVCPSVPVRH